MQYFGYLPDRGLPAAFVCLFREHLNSSICHCLAFSSATQQREDSTRPHTTNFPIETVAIRHSTPQTGVYQGNLTMSRLTWPSRTISQEMDFRSNTIQAGSRPTSLTDIGR